MPILYDPSLIGSPGGFCMNYPIGPRRILVAVWVFSLIIGGSVSASVQSGVVSDELRIHRGNEGPPEPDVESTCENFSRAKKWAYCIVKTKGSQNNDVLFYFHGVGSSH